MKNLKDVQESTQTRAELVREMADAVHELRRERETAALRRLIRIPEFAGEFNPMKARCYVHKVRAYQEAYGIDDPKMKVHIFSARLQEDAGQWLDTLIDQNPEIGFEDLCEAFLRHFAGGVRKSQIDKLYESLRQETTVAEYIKEFQEFSSLLPKGMVTSDGVLEDFINGLKPTIQNQVRLSRPLTLDDAMENAIWIDEDLKPELFGAWGCGKPSRYQRPYAPTPFRVADHLRPADPDSMEVGAMRNGRPTYHKNRSNYQKTLVCWYCHRAGHVRRNCPELAKNQSGQQ
ncbi:DEKNAAC103146 [Brettanomyces naardenensis]|uniref:DEKNAAC103146 n=1 Tax=Brettanomyces naardenensis TaxID=13370 RepID=A0A448YMF3_BRENA|nr:DEKNAAC103146 [Brettanomyces naardenensis]